MSDKTEIGKEIWDRACITAMRARIEEAIDRAEEGDVACLADAASTAFYLCKYEADDTLREHLQDTLGDRSLAFEELVRVVENAACSHQLADYALAAENDFQDRARASIGDEAELFFEGIETPVAVPESALENHEEER